MTQHVLMILPSTEDESTRLVGPFLAEHLAHRWADTRGIDPVRRLVRPLEQPKSIYSQGRHALVPSPHPRDLMCEACGKPFLPTHSIAAPGPTTRHPFRNAIARELDQEIAHRADELLRERREPTPTGVPSLTGGIRHWITGEALELAPWNVMGEAEAVANWSGPIARFNHPTTDGRTLELNGAGSGDWISHFTRVPVGVWVMVPNVGALPIGLCERVRVEDGWLMAEGRISLGHFQRAAPKQFAEAVPSWESGVYTADMVEKLIPAAIDVTNGVRGGTPGALTITGLWELERVVFGSVPAWPGCRVRLGTFELETKR